MAEDPECADEPVTDLCDGDKTNNVWVPGYDPENGHAGICMLKTMTEAQIINVLQRNETARKDLRRVTTNARLLELADTIKRFPTHEPADKQQTTHGRAGSAGAFYTQFQGRFPSR